MTDTQPGNGATTPEKVGGRPKGSTNRQPAMKISEIAIEINTGGFDAARQKHGKRLTPKIACKVIDYMRKVVGDHYEPPAELKDFADKKRPGRAINGPMTAPRAGECRPYSVSDQGRIGIPVDIVGVKPGGTVWALFDTAGVVITASKPEDA